MKCVPPENKPLPQEIRSCNRFLAQELAGLSGVRVYLALGRIAHDALLMALGLPRARYPFAHARVHALGKQHLIDSYHCSRYNTSDPAADAGYVSRRGGRGLRARGPGARLRTTPECSSRRNTSHRCRSARACIACSAPGTSCCTSARHAASRIALAATSPPATSIPRSRRWCSRSRPSRSRSPTQRPRRCCSSTTSSRPTSRASTSCCATTRAFPTSSSTHEHEFPRLLFYRGARSAGTRYFGPFPSAGAVRDTLQPAAEAVPHPQLQ